MEQQKTNAQSKQELGAAGKVTTIGVTVASVACGLYTYLRGHADPHIVNEEIAAIGIGLSVFASGFVGTQIGQIGASICLNHKKKKLAEKNENLQNPMQTAFAYARRGLIIGGLTGAILCTTLSKFGTNFLKHDKKAPAQTVSARLH